ncbi:MAG: hypothetical protein MJZ20_07875, partial [Bacteroidaceae bacterium]|nr:hypothetical protein [Bacteroidaceae bacterium]
TVLTILFAALLPIGLMAQGNITEPGATSPNQLYTTTYDNPGGPNHAPGGPNRVIGDNMEPDDNQDSQTTPYDGPVGAPWALLAFAAAYGAFRLIRRRGVEE